MRLSPESPEPILSRPLSPCPAPADATVAACGACNNVVTFPPRPQAAAPQPQPSSVAANGLLSAGAPGAFAGNPGWGAAAPKAPGSSEVRSTATSRLEDSWTQWPAQNQGSLGLSGGTGLDWAQQQAPAAAPPPRARRDQARSSGGCPSWPPS